MSFCFLYNVVSENYSVQNSPGLWEGGGWGKGRWVYGQPKVYQTNNYKENEPLSHDVWRRCANEPTKLKQGLIP